MYLYSRSSSPVSSSSTCSYCNSFAQLWLLVCIMLTSDDLEWRRRLSLPVPILVVTWFCFLVTKAVYRLHFHPLASIPGPRIWAVSRWFAAVDQVYLETYLTHLPRPEYYYDLAKSGRFWNEIKKAHEIYGLLSHGRWANQLIMPL